MSARWRLEVEGPIEAVLAEHQVLTVRPCGIGTRITCLDGTAWITVAGDRRDHVLGMRGTLRLGAHGLVVAYALTACRLRLVTHRKGDVE